MPDPLAAQPIGARGEAASRIATACLALPGVRACRVVGGEGGLVVWLEADRPPAGGLPPAVAALLPPGVRRTVAVLPRLPLTPEGEVDEAALAALAPPREAAVVRLAAAVAGLPGVTAAAAVWHDPAALTRPVLHLEDVTAWGSPAPSSDAAGLPPRPGFPSPRLDGTARPPALAQGPPLAEEPPVTLDRLLRAAVAAHPAARLDWEDENGTLSSLVYSELLAMAERVAGTLRRLAPPGGRVILLTSDPRTALTGLWACLLAGLAAAPLPPPAGEAALANLGHAWELLGRPPLLGAERNLEDLRRRWPTAAGTLPAQGLDEALGGPRFCGPAGVAPDDPALVLFTSGSTGLPKGVPLTHRGLRHSQRGAEARLGISPQDRTANWLPLDHVAGLVFMALHPSLRGAGQAHVPTSRVMRDPLALLDLLSRDRPEVGFLPNFAFGLVAGQAEAILAAARERPRRWDFGHLKVLVSGGEAVVADSARRFLDLLAPFGLAPGALRPGFGMSESGGGASFAHGLAALAPPQTAGRSLTSLGKPVPGLALRVVDEAGNPLREGEVGQVQLAGPALTRGYLGDAAADAEAFRDGWFATGDLGLLADGALYLAGRSKDLIIVNGLNYGSHELEALVERADGVAAAQAAAVAVRPPGAETDELAVFFCPESLPVDPPEAAGPGFWQPADGEALAALAGRVRRAVVEGGGPAPDHCLPLPKGSLPRTAVGKLRRAQLREDFQAGRYRRLARAMDFLEGNARVLPDWFHQRVWRPRRPEPAAPRPGLAWLILDAGQPLAGLLAEEAGRAGIAVRRVTAAGLAGSTLPPADLVVDLRLMGGAAAPADPLAFLAPAAGRGAPAYVLVAEGSLAARPGEAPDPGKARLLPLAGYLRDAGGPAPRLVDPGPEGVSPAALLAELRQSDAEPRVAWREGARLVPRYRPLALPPAAAGEAAGPAASAWLVAGEPAGVGLALCRRLLARGGKRLAVVGEAREEALAVLAGEAAARGGEFAHFPADLADPAGLERVLTGLPGAWRGPRAVVLLGEEPGRREPGAAAEAPGELARLVRREIMAAQRLGGLYPGRFCTVAVAGGPGDRLREAVLAAREEVLGPDALVATLGATAVARPEMAAASLEAVWPLGRGVVRIGGEEDFPAFRRQREVPPRPPRALTVFYEPAKRPPSALARELAEAPAAEGGWRGACTLLPLPALPRGADGQPDREALRRRARDPRGGGGAPPASGEERLVAAAMGAVLGREPGSTSDNFFALGGHSLQAMRLAARIAEASGRDFPVELVFADPTVAGLARRLAQSPRPVAAGPSLAPAPSGDEAPVSSGQHRLWLLEQVEGPGHRYNNGLGLRLRGTLDRPALEKALGLIVARHEPLRTILVAGGEGGSPVQRILPAAPVSLGPQAVAEGELMAAAGRCLDRPFALSRDLPARFALLEAAPDDHLLVICLHHAASDGWSFAILLDELGEAYGALAAGREPALPPLPASYRQFAAWQRGRAARQAAEVEFWRKRLTGVPPLLDLPLDHPRPARQRFRGGHHWFRLPAELTARLRRLATAQGATLPMALLAGFAALLGRLARQERVVLGLPAANRPRPEFAPLIGFFVNTLALSLGSHPEESFRQHLAATARELLAGLRREGAPLEAVVEAVKPVRSPRHAPLFQAMFAYQSRPPRAPLLPGLTVETVPLAPSAALFDLFLTLEEDPDGGLAGRLTYDADLWEAASAARLAEQLATLLARVADAPDRPLQGLDLLPPAQRRLVLAEWQGGPPAAPAGGPNLAGLLARRAADSPRAVILLGPGGEGLACGELFAQAQALAAELAARGARPGRPLGIMLPRGADWLRALAAALLSGCPWLALDPAAPPRRLARALAAGGLELVVTAPELAGRLAGLPVVAAPCRAARPAPAGFVPPGPALGPDAPAYLLLTSGSTGEPKVVVGPNRGMVNRLHWQWTRYPYAPGEVCCLRAATTFADSVAEALGPLLAGVPVAPLTDREIRDPARLVPRLAELEVTRLLLVPSQLRLLLDAVPDLGARLPRLRLWSVSGEPLPADLVARFRESVPGARLLNLYGSSEVSADVTWQEFAPADDPPAAGEPVAIGRPLPGNRVYVLGPDREPLPPGVPGELFVAGEHLAQGYLGDLARTAEAFPPEPAWPAATPGGRMFATGDLGRHLADGRIEYLGRRDFLISLHGLRIEPGEVEAVLREHPRVKDAAVAATAPPGGEPALTAYLVPATGAEGDLTARELREFAAARLAATQVPHRWQRLAALPLLPNGKLDRRALPPPSPAADLPAGLGGAAPATPGERLVAAAMAEVLGRPPAAVDDDFFALGGHSLLAVRLAARIAEAAGRDFPVELVFADPTVAGLARGLAKAGEATEGPALVARGHHGAPPLSLPQRRLWLHHQLTGPDGSYLLRACFGLRGELDPARLGRALELVLARHLPLRTLHGHELGEPRLGLLAPGEALAAVFGVEDLAGLAPAARRDRLAELGREILDPSRVPPLAVRLALLGPGEARLFFTWDHLAWDGWSTQVFFPELAEAYRALGAGREPAWPPLAVSYHDYAAWSQERLAAGSLAGDLAFWRANLAGAPVPAPLLPREPDEAGGAARGAVRKLRLEPAALAGLAALARRRGETLHVLLLGALTALTAVYGGEPDVVLGVMSAGRTRPALHGLVGFFANALPLRLPLEGVASWEELLALAARASREALIHQEPPLDLIVKELGLSREPGQPPLFRVLLAHQNEPFPLPALPGVAVEELPAEPGPSPLDLVFEPQPDRAGGLGLAVTYAPDRLSSAGVARLAGHYLAVLRHLAALADLAAPWRELPPADPGEPARLAELSRGPRRPLPAPCLVHELILARAAEDPAAPAVAGPRGRLSRGELAARAGKLANALAARLPAAGEPLVALHLEPGPGYVAAWLGILRAGAAVLPLDPAWPAGRVARVLAAARPALYLGEPDAAPPPLPAGTRLLDPTEAAPAPPPPELPADGRRLAYVIATSGTTGEPKLVAVEHRALVNLALAQAEPHGVTAASRAFLLVSPAFDVAMGELATLLLAGGVLVLAERRAAVPGRELVELLAREGVNHLSCPVSALAALPAGAPAALTGLATLVLGGEPCPEALAAPWLPGRRIINAYGPSEATVCATATPYRGARDIGRPLANLQALVLDPAGRLLPRGAPGELCLAGEGLARGYLGRPELTEAAFRPSPLAAGGRLYRSGDRARWREDGGLEFLGRLDSQVKVGGVRVEPLEVAALLEALPGVARAVVVPRGEAAARRLAAYYQPAPGGPAPDPAELRLRLAERLPGQAVPAWLVPLKRLPLTPSGKLDAKALPDPGGEAPAASVAAPPAAPPAGGADRGEVRRTLRAIWAEVLGRVPGEEENFFDAGGHSLLLARVQALIEDRLGRRVSMVDLFRHASLAALARALEGEPPAAPAAPAAPVAPAFFRREAAPEPLAVVGMACRLPGAPDLDAFWRALREGRELITRFAPAALLAAGEDPARLADPAYVPAGGFVEGIDRFDAAFFGLSPREAALLDPQQRVFMQCAWHALEHAGHAPGREGLRAAVFAGSGHNQYLARAFPAGPPASAEGFAAHTGNGPDFLASRLAYLLNLTGPAVGVQTACSTSLVAVALACQALWAGQADLALAGGVSLPLAPRGYLHREGLIFSPDGHCRPFDARARGTVPSGGCGVVCLRPLEAALADGDTVHALIRGVALNNDGGAKAGYTAPGVAGQVAVIRAALAQAGVDPAGIGYVEAHGTGTELGDPIEVAALREAYGLGGPPRIVLGSVKGNLGHADAAAGVVGLIKAVLCLGHGEIPATLHFREANPRLGLEEGPFLVAGRARPWPRGEAPRRAAVSSFGIGGTNAHAVLEEAPPPPPPPDAGGGEWRVLAISAKSQAAREELSRALGERLAGGEVRLEDAALTLARGRPALPFRRALVTDDAGRAGAVLAGQAPAGPAGGDLSGEFRGGEAPPLCFLLPGQGSQYPGMARGLFAGQPVFAGLLEACRDALRPRLGRDVLPYFLEPERPAEEVNDTALAQPLLFSLEYALAGLLGHYGLRPAALLGHSLGELTAACLAGVFDLTEALALVAERGRLMAGMPPGSMLAAALGEAEAAGLVAARPGLALAAVNGPRAVTLAGPSDLVAATARELADRGVAVHPLATSHAFHSAAMAPAAEALARFAAGLHPAPPRVPVYGNPSGRPLTAAEWGDPGYWARQMLAPVRFGPALADPALAGHLAVEVGPGRALAGLAGAAGMTCVGLVRRAGEGRPDPAVFLEGLARLWLLGARPDLAAGLPAGARRVPLAPYPFARERHWLEAPTADPAAPVLEAGDPARWFHAPAWRPAPAPAGEAAPFPGRWLLLAGEDPLGGELARAIADRGGEALLVRPGEAPGPASLRPGAGEDFADLLAGLAARGREPQAILHLWSLEPEVAREDSAALDLALGSLLALAKALADQGGGRPCRLGLVTRGLHRVSGEEAASPLPAAGLAALKVLAGEQGELTCRGLDLAPGAADPAALLAEFLAGTEPVVALRGGRRWLPAFGPLPLAEPRESPFRRGGFYWLTGGLGGMGLGLARELAAHCGARLLLTSRRGLSGDDPEAAARRRAVAEIEARGGEALALAADAADRPAMAAALAAGMARFGRLNGVIHAAGLADGGGLIRRRDWAATRTVLAPKLAGTQNLLALLRAEAPDAFLVLCASLGNLLPGHKFAQAGYAAANEYLDAVAGQVRDLRVLALDWDDWGEAGMAVRAAAEWRERHAGAVQAPRPALTAAQGFTVLGRALASREPRLAVCLGDLPALLAEDARAPELLAARLVPGAPAAPDAPDAAPATGGHPRPDLAGPYLAPAPGVESELAAIWQEVLGIDRVGVLDDFFALGGHSLLATRLVALIRERLGVNLALGAVFEAATPRAMAARLATAEPAGSEMEEHAI